MTLHPSRLIDYLSGEGPIPVVDFREWQNLDSSIHAALALAYHHGTLFRPLLLKALELEVAYVVAETRPGTEGCYDRGRNLISVDRTVVEQEGLDIVASILCHEIVHAVGTFATDPVSCFEEELMCWTSGAYVFGVIPRHGTDERLRTPRYEAYLRMFRHAQQRLMQQYVLLSPTYQRRCLGREVVG